MEGIEKVLRSVLEDERRTDKLDTHSTGRERELKAGDEKVEMNK